MQKLKGKKSSPGNVPPPPFFVRIFPLLFPPPLSLDSAI